MGLTCSQSATRTRPHLLFGETRPSSIPSCPPPALLQSPSFQLLSSTCKPEHHHHSTTTTTITAVGSNTRGQYRSTTPGRALPKPLAAGHPLPSSPLICRGAALSRPSASQLYTYLVLALPSEDLFFPICDAGPGGVPFPVSCACAWQPK